MVRSYTTIFLIIIILFPFIINSCGNGDLEPSCKNDVKPRIELGWWPIQVGNSWEYYTITHCATVQPVKFFISAVDLPNSQFNPTDSLIIFIIEYSGCLTCQTFNRFAMTTDSLKIYSLNLDIRVSIETQLYADFGEAIVGDSIFSYNQQVFLKGIGPLKSIVFGADISSAKINGINHVIDCDDLEKKEEECEMAFGHECQVCMGCC